MSEEGGHKEEILLKYSSLIEKLQNFLKNGNICPETTSAPASPSAFEEEVKKIFVDISSIQRDVEKNLLLNEGKELYSKWLQLVENHGGNDLKQQTSLAYNNRGFLKYLEVDFEGAIRDYTAALKYNPVLPCAFYNRGLVNYRMGFFNQALKDVDTAIQLDSSCKEFQEGFQRIKQALLSSGGSRTDFDVTVIPLLKEPL